ncbi:hypothetical protein [Amycolatopsis sp. H20-H5]|uniref:hypothetical protein n=1 Tax=Amycolatopsis sp. H20-H5 TaxID=3046309 RepID=UPI002DB642BE|nr:hypothetical protein [Amycolatopsis sp. H20-H5]MEC3980717.1 hypothetical protein [Amycolatopsis sp. H20-H5]
MPNTKKTFRALTGIIAAAGLVTGVFGAGSASANTQGIQATGSSVTGTDQGGLLPKGARAHVEVGPNPTLNRGEEVTITGNCGGGTGLKAVYGGSPEHSILENPRILKADPHGFVAKATLAPNVGNGVGPILVDCGGEAGVTLLVTHV